MSSPVYFVAVCRGKDIAAGLDPDRLVSASLAWLMTCGGFPEHEDMSIDLLTVGARDYARVRGRMPDVLRQAVDQGFVL